MFIWCDYCGQCSEPPGIRICSVCKKEICMVCDPRSEEFNWYPLDDDIIFNLESLFTISKN